EEWSLCSETHRSSFASLSFPPLPPSRPPISPPPAHQFPPLPPTNFPPSRPPISPPPPIFRASLPPSPPLPFSHPPLSPPSRPLPLSLSQTQQPTTSPLSTNSHSSIRSPPCSLLFLLSPQPLSPPPSTPAFL
ncbi:unnamed protein product, partial [Closterium sp. Naga37s-1]